ncbi:hypothetical protein [Burkholderia ubonensis]|uniref:hypothetical protein n=1 Tax=Burkholderia ubonensis TaxID=101571 RepID=UPI00075D1D40|nr:hypothetical protein [Burkholderia ubonensis]KVA14127.1 hypothetical protein WI43_25330 [Burkholderia ubonensis]KVA23243.1 hypothetical protein WI42_06870 [Burkholderia ubonensis]KVA52852.1 hypothetical protein WI46_26980 [Burkholderia ubonensis]
MSTARHPGRAALRITHVAHIAHIARVGAVSLGLLALVAWSFAGYLTPSALLSLLTGFSLCG